MSDEQLYMLRLWQDGCQWRASLKNMLTREVKYFNSLESFTKYATQLAKQTKLEQKNLP